MKFLNYFAWCAFAMIILGVPNVHAQDEMPVEAEAKAEEDVLTLDEAKALIMTRPGAKDATNEVVKDFSLEFYDIYGRQLQYRENAKEFRAMLETRRYSYQRPYVAMRDAFDDVRMKVYEAERAAYQAQIEAYNNSLREREAAAASAAAEDAPKAKMEPVSLPQPDEPINAPAADDNGDDVADDGPVLREKDIPDEEGADAEQGATKKKVVVSDDAPDFDPSNL